MSSPRSEHGLRAWIGALAHPLSGASRVPPTWKAPCIGAKEPAGVCRETLARIDEAKHLCSGLRRIRSSGARKGNSYFVDPKVNVKISKGSGPENTKGARVGYVSRDSEAGDGPVISDVKERAWEPIFGTVGGAPNE